MTRSFAASSAQMLDHGIAGDVAWRRDRRRPLATLLSQLLIAFTIEFDNEAEHRLPHRTTQGGASGQGRGPWLVSQAMWANFMQFVGEDGVPLREIGDLAGLTNLAGLERWRYITVGPDPADQRPAPPRRDWIVRPTSAGRRTQEVWEPLAGSIEGRWRARYGAGEIGALRRSLQAVTGQRDEGQPRLAQGLRPYPGGWRAAKPYLRQTTAVLRDPHGALPRYPMVLHRGGWPDGS